MHIDFVTFLISFVYTLVDVTELAVKIVAFEIDEFIFNVADAHEVFKAID